MFALLGNRSLEQRMSREWVSRPKTEGKVSADEVLKCLGVHRLGVVLDPRMTVPCCARDVGLQC